MLLASFVCYYVWQERKQRVFQENKTSVDELSRPIVQTTLYRGCHNRQIILVRGIMQLNYCL